MKRTNSTVISGWPAVLLLSVFLPAALMVRLIVGRKRWEAPVKRTADDVASFIEDFVDGTGGEWDWDEFESVPIADPRLNALRKRAVMMGPPNANIEGLRGIAAEARALV